MKEFDNLWLKVAKDNNINIWLNRRYVDDMRNMLSGIEKGWRWSKHESCFVYKQEWYDEDKNLNKTNEIHTTKVLLDAMNDIMPFLNLTSECSHDFIDGRLPTLDCSIFIKNQTFMHTFFEKPTRSEKSLDAKSPLSASAMQSSLRQEVIRIAIHPDVQFSELKEALGSLPWFINE